MTEVGVRLRHFHHIYMLLPPPPLAAMHFFPSPFSSSLKHFPAIVKAAAADAQVGFLNIAAPSSSFVHRLMD
jgi:hypothetical protein